MSGYFIGMWLFILLPVLGGSLLLILGVRDALREARTPPPRKTEPAGYSVVLVADRTKEKDR